MWGQAPERSHWLWAPDERWPVAEETPDGVLLQAAEVGAAAGEGPDSPQERRGSCETGRQQQSHDVRPRSGANGLPRRSFWLDLWLFILFDVVLFLFMYLLP
ncbi:PREDICTED: uncharacterized protein C4orf3-like [Galeopterus variegatus]|uniref:Uncharacterized protein C4orf3-like n=1 Tax=Galeopterus variegatus TaxID=482537 RepID=A0ABM0RGL1_GALVR|nr:PREDICTED: uncharacterized protein C4orf3-like [Galeopterus variegatus]